MRELWRKILGWLEALEFIVPALLAAVILVLGPLLATLYLARKHHPVAAVVSLTLWMLAVAGIIRDRRRQRFGWVSLTLGFVWLSTTLIVWWKLS